MNYDLDSLDDLLRIEEVDADYNQIRFLKLDSASSDDEIKELKKYDSYLKDQIGSDEAHFYVCYIKKRAIGYGAYWFGEITDLYIRSDYQKLSIGETLLSHIEQRILEKSNKKKDTIRLTAISSAEDFYLKNGYYEDTSSEFSPGKYIHLKKNIYKKHKLNFG